MSLCRHLASDERDGFTKLDRGATRCHCLIHSSRHIHLERQVSPWRIPRHAGKSASTQVCINVSLYRHDQSNATLSAFTVSPFHLCPPLIVPSRIFSPAPQPLAQSGSLCAPSEAHCQVMLVRSFGGPWGVVGQVLF